ncbi:MAG: phasin family protein [Methylocystis sp.]
MTWEGISQPAAAMWAPLRMGQVYGAKLMEFSADNVNSTLEFFGELSGAKTPADLAEAVSNQTRRRMETLTEQFDELSRLFGATKADDKAAEKAVDFDDVGLGD